MKTSNKILLAVGILLTAFLVYYWLRFKHFEVTTIAMLKDLNVGDIILIDKYFDEVERNRIYAFEYPQSNFIASYRAVGLPGDTIVLKDAKLKVNGVGENNDNLFYQYSLMGGEFFDKNNLMKHKLVIEINGDDYGHYMLFSSDVNVDKIRLLPSVKSIDKVIHPKGYRYLVNNLELFPNHQKYNWSRDNFGPLVVPKKGEEIELSIDNLPLYEAILEKYEENTLEIRGDNIYINNQKTEAYTFNQNYYWMMGNNRHNSQDSRYFGFVPEDKIIGVYKTTLYSPK